MLLACMSLAGAVAQIQNVNILGTYTGTFMLSGTTTDYEIAGSPYLSETWMFGSLEMKGDIIEKTRESREVKSQLRRYTAMIEKIDRMIEKLSDPDFRATGLALTMKSFGGADLDTSYNVWIANSDFDGMEDITGELEDKLLFYLEQLKAAYEAEINDYFKISGLFRYNLYAQEFEMVYGRDTFAIAAPFDLKSITISNKKFIHGLYVKRGSRRPYLGSSYFEVIADGDCKLLMRHDVRIKSSGGPVTHSWAGGGDAFVQYSQLYYQKEEGSEVILLKNRKKKIRELFADRSGEMERFIRSEHLRIKHADDLARLFDHYNELSRSAAL